MKTFADRKSAAVRLLILGMASAVTMSLASVIPALPAEAAAKDRPAVQKFKPVDVKRVGAKRHHASKGERLTKTPLPAPAWPKKGLKATGRAEGTWVETVDGIAIRTPKEAKPGRQVTVTSLGHSASTDGFTFQLETGANSSTDPAPTAPTPTPTDKSPSKPSPTMPSPSKSSAEANQSLYSATTPTVPPAASETSPDDVQVQVDYSTFAAGYGADWADRLRVVRVNDCKQPCQTTTVLPSVNDTEHHTLTLTTPVSETAPESAGSETAGGATVAPSSYKTATSTTNATTLSVEAAPAGTKGDYSASPLAPSSSWSAGVQSGDFTWSYPFDTPPGVGGPEPDIGLSYSSGAVDGRTAASNNQTSWVGEGFSLDPGSVQRFYVPCRDVDGDTTGSDETDDQCWRGDNLALSFGDKSGKLIQSGSSDSWRLQNDDGTKIEHVTGGHNGDNNGEYWIATTTDGTKYYFGVDDRPGVGGTETQSVSTIPVYGSKSGEPCHDSSFGSSQCDQGWRWSLDYVVDAHGNTMSYFYNQETNKYGANKGADTLSYDRGQYLDHIDYGTRTSGSATDKAPARVDFTVAERCMSNCTDITDTENGKNWPDVPTDQICSSSCSTHWAPTFFSRKRLTTVTTQVLDGDTYDAVNEWSLTQSFPDSGDDYSRDLWLESIKQTGKVGGSTALPAITFLGAQFANRVDANGDGISPFYKRRISSIDNGMGGVTSVNYSAQECTSTNKPTEATLNSNAKRCFPVYYQLDGDTNRRLEFFNKYRVDQVVESDNTGGAPAVVTSYTYTGSNSWHFDDADAQRPKYRTWNQWRGYSEVATAVGSGPTKSFSTTLYMRGMNGDRNSATDASAKKTVNVTDSIGGATSIPDDDQYAGFTRRTQTKLGSAGAVLSTEIATPWSSAATAENGGGEKAYIVETGSTKTSTPITSGTRVTNVATTYNTMGLPTQVSDGGDAAVAADDRCTTTTYATSTAKWLYLPATKTTVAKPCGTAAASADDVVSASRTYYDGASSLTADPDKGDPTKVESASGWDSGITYQADTTSTYDAYGRPLTVTDAKDATTTTDYSPATGIPTSTAVTNALDQTTRSSLNREWGSISTKTDPAGLKTEYSFDALGRVASVWAPGRDKATKSASVTYDYTTSSSAANAVTTKTLNSAGGYTTSVQLFDGQMRERSTQTQAAGSNAGRVITENIYDDRGLVRAKRGPYWNTDSGPQANLVSAAENTIDTATNFAFDAAGRQTSESLISLGNTKWTTTTAYTGDKVSVTPVAGGTASSTTTDARGQTTKLQQFTGTTPTGTSQDTTYAYTPAGKLKTVTNAAGNVWSRKYDIRGRLIEAKDPDSGTTTYGFNAVDQQVSTHDARDSTLWTVYDKLGRKTELRDDNASGTLRAKWDYDATTGRLESSTRIDGGDSYINKIESYDAGGRPKVTSLTLPASDSGLLVPGQTKFTTTNAYNVDGSLQSQQLPSAYALPDETLRYDYDANGNALGLSGSGTIVADTYRSPYGQVTGRDMGPTTGKEIYDTRDYDLATGRLSRHWASIAGSATTPQIDLNYSYDASGNVKALNDIAAGDTTTDKTASLKQCFDYDFLRRMTKAWTSSKMNCEAPNSSKSNLGSITPYFDTYTFGKDGNRLTQVAVTKPASSVLTTTSTYTYPAATAVQPHAVSKVVDTGSTTGTKTFTYDPAGSLVTRKKASATDQTVTWNIEGHQKTVTDSAGHVTSFVYDADGNRLIKRDGADSSTTLFMGQTEIVLKGTDSTATRSYTLEGEAVAIRAGSTTAPSKLKIVIADHQGTPVLNIDSSSLAVAKRRYKPFGETLASAATWPDTRGYLNKTTDVPAGSAHLDAREFDAALGRFTTVDPVLDTSDPQQMNGYAYANNTPVTSADPTGLFVPCQGANCKNGTGGAYLGPKRDGRTKRQGIDQVWMRQMWEWKDAQITNRIYGAQPTTAMRLEMLNNERRYQRENPKTARTRIDNQRKAIALAEGVDISDLLPGKLELVGYEGVKDDDFLQYSVTLEACFGVCVATGFGNDGKHSGFTLGYGAGVKEHASLYVEAGKGSLSKGPGGSISCSAHYGPAGGGVGLSLDESGATPTISGGYGVGGGCGAMVSYSWKY